MDGGAQYNEVDAGAQESVRKRRISSNLKPTRKKHSKKKQRKLIVRK